MARNARTAQDGRSAGVFVRIAGLVTVIALWAFVVASLIGFDPKDPPSHVHSPLNDPVMNWCGPIGAYIAHWAFTLLGYAAWVLALCVTIGLLSAAIGKSVQHAIVRLIGAVMMTAAIAGIMNLVAPNIGPMPDLSGGLVGVTGVGELRMRFGALGAAIVLCVFAVVGAIVAMDEWVIAFFGWAYRLMLERGVPAAKTVTVTAGSAALSASGTVAKAGADGVSSGVSYLWGRMFNPKLKSKRKPRLTDTDDDTLSPAAAKRRAAEKAAKLGQFDPNEEIEDPDLALTGAPPTPLKKGRKLSKSKTPVSLNPNDNVDLDDLDGLDAELASPDDESDDEDAQPVVELKPTKGRGSSAKSPAAPQALVPSEDDSEEQSDPTDDDEAAKPAIDTAALKAKMAKLPIIFGQDNKKIATDADLAAMQRSGDNLPEDPSKPYKFPGLDLLEQPEENFSLTLKDHVNEQGAQLMAALQEYNINGRVVDAESGPAVTMYNVKLAAGTKVAALSAVQSDIARSLRAVNIRIVANMAGRDTIGIEVPNTTREKVRLKELMGHTEIYGKMKLPMFLGKDAGGTPLIQDLAKMPHMLIAGTTGSGKSVCMNTIIMGFLYTKRPSELKLVLVDPKMVEMSQFKDIPHLMCPVVTEMPKAAAILDWACNKMEERYATLQEAGCRDIASYNELSWEELKERVNPGSPEEEAQVPRKLPYIVIVIDELADLMMTNREVEGSIIRIAQKARAVGIHLILATQRPQREVVTGLIKANMPARMTFKVSSGMDSRIVLDQKGGELLLGQGDCLFLTPSSSTIMRAQGTLVDDREIRRVVKFMKEVASPSFERSLMQIKSGGTDEQRIEDSRNNSSASLQAAQEDPMFQRAVEIVLETRRGSVSLLQRRLAIGYTRASRLVDLMGIAGIISDHKGSVARDVLITIEEWQAMQAMMEEQARAQGISLESLNASIDGDTVQEPADASGDEADPDTLPPERNSRPASPKSATLFQEEAPFDTDDEGEQDGNEPQEDDSPQIGVIDRNKRAGKRDQ
jgi:S-DNA-T family DNA segregation ATPase FtsK/SpoIIIE